MATPRSAALVTPATGPSPAAATLVLAHGAGAPMDSPFMTAMAERIASYGITVHRFEFAFMAARRTGGKRPAPKAERLCGEYRAIVPEAARGGRLFIGGKSLGGRVASMVADALYADGRIAGLVCLGYPFHPPKKPQILRTAHLATLTCPTLIVQGTADPLGDRKDVEGYSLSPSIALHWIEAADHDLMPRTGARGTARTAAREAALDDAATAIQAFVIRAGG